jgi:polyisoprenoid-binding protein YceI
MKNFKTIAFAFLIACTTATISAQTKKVEVASSKVTWVGKKITGQHEGTVNLKEGNLIFKGKALVGGNFVVDMTTVVVTDLKTGEGKEKLEGHLNSEDFFGTEKHKTANMVFKSVANKGNNLYAVTADLIIKGKTNSVTFNISINGNKATTNLKVDRTKYDIKYGSGSFFDNLGDKAISDNFDLMVEMSF